MEQIVTERTFELKQAHVELEKALEKEKQLNELKSRFLSMASHEFKTPLTSILSSASLIEKYTEASAQSMRQKHVDRIKSSVVNLTNILNDFLSIEKIESGLIKHDIAELSLDEFINSLIDELAPLLHKNQVIKYEHNGNLKIYVDQHLLKNVLINLLSNAIKYSLDGKDIIIKSRCEENKLKIDVIDEGIGIPDEDKIHMFERFFRAGNASNIQGTGNGLTIVKRYLDLLGGSINFESEIDKGTRFFVEIPVLIE